MPKEVTRWACEHERCKKTYSRKNDTILHEKTCAFNPRNWACPTCRFDEKKTVDVGGGLVNEIPYCSEGADRDGKPWISGCGYWLPKDES